MPDQTDREPIELLAEEFLDRRRQGERVTVEDYASAHPDKAGEIRDLFPTIVALEEAKSDDKPKPSAAFECPERLDDLRLVREIGRGGMGVVYEAEQESLGRRVAVKVLPGRALFDTKQLERFRREARTAGALQHPGIVPIYSVGEKDGLHYLVMQLVDGAGLDVLTRRVGARTKSGTLASASSLSLAGEETIAMGLEDGLAEALLHGEFDSAAAASDLAVSSSDDTPTIVFSGSGSMADSVRAASLGMRITDDEPADVDALDPEYYRSVAKVGAQAAEALAYAHARGTLHRDIKPANLLLDRTGRVWITDFGLAKAVDQNDLSRTGEVLGTLRYMAPEQLRGEATAESDLYSLGLTLYELVTFRSPFDATTASEVLQKINEHRPVRPRKLNPKLPADLEKVIVKAMAAAPNERYKSGDAMAADLRRFLDDQPVMVARPSLLKRAKRWADCHQAAVFALLAIALVGSGVVLGTTLFWPPPPEGRPPLPQADGQTDEGFSTGAQRLGPPPGRGPRWQQGEPLPPSPRAGNRPGPPPGRGPLPRDGRGPPPPPFGNPLPPRPEDGFEPIHPLGPLGPGGQERRELRREQFRRQLEQQAEEPRVD